MSLDEAALRALVERKRRGGEHTREEIELLVNAYCAGGVDDEHFADWLRAVVTAGLSDDETAWLTRAMASSGIMLSWDDVPGTVVDKHSTGGVGDAVSLIAVPLAAACGVRVAKLSGRALGHTGGTVDKLEALPNLRTDLSVTAFKRQVADVGCAIAQATDQIAPADKKIYALRHRTQTVASIGLITASVLSKKIAGGAPYLVIDVKCGSCAFMKTHADARGLARTMVQVGRRLNRCVTALITDMDEPLAMSIGDALELDEAISVLQGRVGGRLRKVALAVAEAMLAVHRSDERAGARARTTALEHALHDGSAYSQFAAMVSAQGGDLHAFERPGEPTHTIRAAQRGYIASIDGRALGEAVAARKSRVPGDATARIGVRLHKRRGDAIERDEIIAEAFSDAGADDLAHVVREAVRIAPQPPEAEGPAVIERLHEEAAGI